MRCRPAPQRPLCWNVLDTKARPACASGGGCLCLGSFALVTGEGVLVSMAVPPSVLVGEGVQSAFGFQKSLGLTISVQREALELSAEAAARLLRP